MKMMLIGAVVAACLAPAFTGRAQAADYIVRDGRAEAEIVIAENPTRAAKLAARELQEHVLAMTGAQLPVVTAPGAALPVRIFVGDSAPARTAGVDTAGLDRDAYRVQVGTGWLALVGRDRDRSALELDAASRADRERVQRRWEEITDQKTMAPFLSAFKGYCGALDIRQDDEVGSLYAVYDFLRGLGVEWYMPGGDGRIVPRRSDIPLPAGSRTVTPDFSRRQFTFIQFDATSAGAEEDVLWYFRLGLGDEPARMFGHSLQNVIGHPETKEKHPEYYLLALGERDREHRGSGRPCLSSEGLFEATVAYVRAVFDAYPEIEAYPVSPPDAYSQPCGCDLCRGKATPGRGGEGLLSDYVWGFVDRVAREIARSHPGRRVTNIAYGAYLLPPEQVELGDNVEVMICRWRSLDVRPEYRDHYREIRRAWQERVKPGQLHGWDYYLHHNRPGLESYGVPVFFPGIIARDLKELKGVYHGEFIEAPRQLAGASLHRIQFPGLNHLNYYLTARLWWDADQDVPALLDRYFREFFGPAEGPMREFVETGEQSWWRLEAADIEKLAGLLEKARAAAGEGVYGRRIALIASECEPRFEQLRLEKAAAADIPSVVVHRQMTDVALSLDGRLDELFWAATPARGLREAVDGAAPADAADFRLTADDTYLYLGARCAEPEMDKLVVATEENNDTNIWVGDSLELLVRTPEHSYYQFAFNPAGHWLDADRARPGLSGLTWDSGLEAAAFRGQDFWSVEARIPLSAFGGEAPAAGRPWHFNLGRARPRRGEVELSLFIPPGRKTFHDLEKMAPLVFD